MYASSPGPPFNFCIGRAWYATARGRHQNIWKDRHRVDVVGGVGVGSPSALPHPAYSPLGGTEGSEEGHSSPLYFSHGTSELYSIDTKRQAWLVNINYCCQVIFVYIFCRYTDCIAKINFLLNFLYLLV